MILPTRWVADSLQVYCSPSLRPPHQASILFAIQYLIYTRVERGNIENVNKCSVLSTNNFTNMPLQTRESTNPSKDACSPLFALEMSQTYQFRW